MTKGGWGHDLFVLHNVIRIQPTVQLGINGRYLPFIENGKDDVFSLSWFRSSTHFDGTLFSDARMPSGIGLMFLRKKEIN
eukprot:6521575-Ditylum_brightwellii.AAC.1